MQVDEVAMPGHKRRPTLSTPEIAKSTQFASAVSGRASGANTSTATVGHRTCV